MRSAFRNSLTFCFLRVLSRCCSNFNRSMLAFRDCDGVVPADGGAAARGVIGRSSSPETVLLEAEVGGATAAVAATSGPQGSLSEALDMAAAGERLRRRKKLRTLLGLQPRCLRHCVWRADGMNCATCPSMPAQTETHH